MLIKSNLELLLELAIHASVDAGEEICSIYDKEFTVDYKTDNSPLTIADTSSHRIICSYLEKTGFPVLSEEGKDIPFEERKSWRVYWLIDPLDGTKEFIKRNGEFTVNIALIESGQPILGVIYVPVSKTLYFGCKHLGSYRIDQAGDKKELLNGYLKSGITLPEHQPDHIFTVVGSKSHLTPETETFIEKLRMQHGTLNFHSKGSSLKICMVAEGSADVYPRFAPTMEWDIAAGHAIAKYAGATITEAETGRELNYNNESMLNPWFIVER